MSCVAITSVAAGVDAAVARALELAGGRGVITPGARVLLKPNWNGCQLAGSTSVAVVQAACRWAHDQGAGEVIVGEGPVPVGRQRIAEYLDELGVPGCLDEVGARFVLFDDDEHVTYRDLPGLPAEIGLARLVLEADVVLNLPLMKVHSTCIATLCLKNFKGCLRPADKMAFHRVGLLPAVIALNRLLPPALHLVDAVRAMEGDHNVGALVPLDLVLAGRDPVAVDAVACAQMGIDPAEVPLLDLAAEAGLGEARLAAIELRGEPLQPRRFERPQERLRRLSPDLEIDDAGACSACGAALMDGLYIAGRDRRVSRVALGPDARPQPDSLVLGKCLQAYWPTHAHVKGCPPSGHKVAEALCVEPENQP